MHYEKYVDIDVLVVLSYDMTGRTTEICYFGTNRSGPNESSMSAECCSQQ